MIQTKVKIPNELRGFGRGSTELAQVAIPARQMERLAKFARETVVARTRAGFGSDDAVFPVLKGGNSRMFLARVNGKATFINRTYAARKLKAGLQGFRDMWGNGRDGGHMLDNFTVRSFSATGARIALTQTKQRQKALANEKRTPFLSFSDSDQAKIVAKAREIFADEVRAIGSGWEALRRFGKRAA